MVNKRFSKREFANL